MNEPYHRSNFYVICFNSNKAAFTYARLYYKPIHTSH